VVVGVGVFVGVGETGVGILVGAGVVVGVGVFVGVGETGVGDIDLFGVGPSACTLTMSAEATASK
jgi:hypothetical protein